MAIMIGVSIFAIFWSQSFNNSFWSRFGLFTLVFRFNVVIPQVHITAHLVHSAGYK